MKRYNGKTAEELAQLMDTHVNLIQEALDSLEAKGLIECYVVREPVSPRPYGRVQDE